MSDPAERPPRLTWRAIDLSRFNLGWFRPGASETRMFFWRLVGMPLVKLIPCELPWLEPYLNAFKLWILRLFGLKHGRNVVVRSCEIYYPWNVTLGDNVWIGYEANLYSLVPIRVGSNVCISQRAFLCTGSHDASEPTFTTLLDPVEMKDGSWACAGAWIAPGVTLHEGAVAAMGSVVVKDIPAMEIWGGNPARKIKDRVVEDRPPTVYPPMAPETPPPPEETPDDES